MFLAFIGGCLFGGTFGAVAMALGIAAGRSDRK